MCQELRVSDQKSRFLCRNPDGEALQNIINKLSDVRNWKDPHQKHYHMSSAQSKKRTTHLDIPGKGSDLYPHVVKTCPFCNSTKPRPDRSRVGGLRADEFGNLTFLDHGFTKLVDQTFGFLIVLDGGTSHLTAYPCESNSPSEVISKLYVWMDTFQIETEGDLTWLSTILMTCRHSIECTM